MPESEKQQHFRLKKKACGGPKCYKQDVNVTARKSRWTSSAADV